MTDAVEAAGVEVLTSEETTTLAAAVRAWPRMGCDCGSSAPALIAVAKAEGPLLVVVEAVCAAVGRT